MESHPPFYTHSTRALRANTTIQTSKTFSEQQKSCVQNIKKKKKTRKQIRRTQTVPFDKCNVYFE